MQGISGYLGSTRLTPMFQGGCSPGSGDDAAMYRSSQGVKVMQADLAWNKTTNHDLYLLPLYLNTFSAFSYFILLLFFKMLLILYMLYIRRKVQRYIIGHRG